LQYPFGPLPSKLAPGIQEKLQDKNFNFTSLKSKYRKGDYRGLGYSDKSISEYLDADFDKNLSNDDIEKRIKSDKDKLHNFLGAGKFNNKIPNINSEEFTPIDKTIEKIYLANGCNATDGDDRIFYDCSAYVYAVVINENSELKKIYPFQFRKYATNMDLASCPSQMEEFSSMVKNFAKNLTMQKYPEKEVEDGKQRVLVSSSMNPYPVFTEYNLDDSLDSSNIYREIMAGGEPGVEVIEKEKSKIKNKEFKLSFRYNNEVTIWNSGVVNTGTDKDTSFSVSVNINGKAFDKKGKEIKDISDDELYKGVYLIYEIINPKSQIYLQESPDSSKFRVRVDKNLESQYLQSKGPILYKGPFLATEYIAVYLVDKGNKPIGGKLLYKVHMKDASPRVEMKKNVMEIDDVADSIFKFRINDEYHDKVKCDIKIPYEKYQANHIPIIKASIEGQGDVSTYIAPFECETNKWISIRIKPPKLSNFNMLSELNGLNMWDLQRGTMESFALDLVGYGVDVRMKNLKKSKQALEGLYTKGYTGAKGVFKRVDKIEKTMRYLDKTNGTAGNVQNAIKLTQIENNADAHSGDLQKAKEITSSKTLLESSYDWGIAGINILQSTVGVVAMAPKHIPFVGKYAQKVTGTFSLVFNLMTNVWKGNLQYLSKEKKIDRAQERNIPYPVMVGVESGDGFRDVNAQVISVLYTYLDK